MGLPTRDFLFSFKSFRERESTLKVKCRQPRRRNATRSAAEIDKIGEACSGSAWPDRPLHLLLLVLVLVLPLVLVLALAVLLLLSLILTPHSIFSTQIDEIGGHAQAEPDRPGQDCLSPPFPCTRPDPFASVTLSYGPSLDSYGGL